MKLKKLLIPLIIIVIVAGGGTCLIIKSVKPSIKTEVDIPPAENQFTKRIEEKIDALGKNAFNRVSYNEVFSLINNYHVDRNFSKESDEDNDKWRGILVRRLFDTYVAKFVSFAHTVFKSPEWKEEDLNLLRDEYAEMKKAEIVEKGERKLLLQPRGATDNLLKEVQEIRRTYDNINIFIGTCANFSQSGGSFPMADIKGKLVTAASYRNKVFKLEGVTFPLCGRTKKRLEEVPQILFNRHVTFLNNKIAASLGKYDAYNSQAEYAGAEWKSVKSEIDALDKDVYGVDSATFARQYNELKVKWNAELPRAANYFDYRDEIIRYLNGNVLDTNQLKNYKDVNKYGTPKKLSGSIDLCLEVWNLNGKNGKTYKDLLNKVIADDNIRYSRLRRVLEQIQDKTGYGVLVNPLPLN
jgi:hypothetical protein